MTILVVLRTGGCVGIVFLPGRAVIRITPMDPGAAHLVTCLGPRPCSSRPTQLLR